MRMENEPIPSELKDSGPFFHGTKVDLQPGDLLEPGYGSNFGEGRKANFIYLTATLDATDKKFPGNPTRSYRTRESLQVVGEVVDWEPHPPEVLQHMRDHLAELKRQGVEAINE
jgi:rifampin ADP-ribosylating transferase